MEWLTDSEIWIGLVTLTALEIVLGIDNIVFISILSGKLPAHSRNRAIQWGLALAMIMRVLLLLSLSWVMGLTRPLFSIVGFDVTGRTLILFFGGLFLLAKSTREIHHRIEGSNGEQGAGETRASFRGVLVQILLLDIVFSLDSVVTAVGMVDEIPVMIVAVLVAVAVMMIFSGIISDFIQRHPTLKMLALSFLLLIGVNLIGDGLGFHIPKGYTYFAMGFSLGVEMLNLWVRKRKRSGPATV
jgi:predicted tellurium resistance membrane protein TerC